MTNNNHKNVSQLLQSAFFNYMHNYKKGLVIVPFPTSIGKTFNSCRAIVDYINKGGAKTVVFITNLLKNLPESEFHRFLEDEYDDTVLKLQSNYDCLVSAYENKFFDDIPDTQKSIFEEKTKEISNAINSVKRLEENKSLNIDDINEKREKISKLDIDFRRLIHNHLRETARKNKKEIKDLVFSDPDYQWVQKIYPNVLTETRQILLMSTKKFIQSCERIISNFEYLDAEWLKDKIVFIDEYDSTKQEVTDTLINDHNNTVEDILNVFKTLKDALGNEKPSFPLAQACEKLSDKRKSLINEGASIESKFKLDLCYKTSDSSLDRPPCFLYCSTSWLTATKSDQYSYPWAEFNKGNNRVDIHFGTKEEQGKAKRQISLNALFSAINKYILHYTTFVKSWANNYEKLHNKKLKDKEQVTSGQYYQISSADALLTVLDVLHLDQNPEIKKIFFSTNTRHKVKDPKDMTRSNGFFSEGCVWYSFANANSHNETTRVRQVKLGTTAENIMLYLAQHCLVIGMSATANCDSVIGNYHAPYLRDRLNYVDEDGQEHTDYHDMMEEDKELVSAIIEELKNKNSAYDDGQIEILEPTILEKEYEKLNTIADIQNVLAVPENKESRQYLKAIQTAIDGALNVQLVNPDDRSSLYLKSKYLNIARTVLEFTHFRNHQSCLLLNMNIPSSDNTSLPKSFIDRVIKYTNRYCSSCYEDWEKEYDDIELLVLDSASFEESMKSFRTKMSEGKRVLVVSTYRTMGAGLNMQYPIPDYPTRYKENLVLLHASESRDTTQKDIDEIAYFDITHDVVNLNDTDNFDVTKQLQNIVDAESCSEAYLITLSDRKKQIKRGFDALQGKKSFKKNIIGKESKPVKRQCTHWMVQADGRTKRTLQRTRQQKIYIYRNVLNALDAEYMKKMAPFLSPELNRLYELSNQTPHSTSSDEILNEAEYKSTSAKRVIKMMVSNINLSEGDSSIHWPEADMKSWKKWRKLVLSHPTASMTEVNRNVFFRDFYIRTSDGPLNKYYYHTINDFDSVHIGFSSKEGFMAQLKSNDDFNGIADEEIITGIREVSEEKSRLQYMLRFPGLKAYFEQEGFATTFKPKEYIINPTMFVELYLGALGEVAGQFILSKTLGIRLDDITDPDKFEAFDFAVAGHEGVYIDFKHHHYYEEEESAKQLDRYIYQRNKITKKMEIINAKSVFVVGILKPTSSEHRPWADGNIIYIPYLIDENGNKSKEMLDYLENKLYEIQNK